jgi:hypothetical protein
MATFEKLSEPCAACLRRTSVTISSKPLDMKPIEKDTL